MKATNSTVPEFQYRSFFFFFPFPEGGEFRRKSVLGNELGHLVKNHSERKGKCIFPDCILSFLVIGIFVFFICSVLQVTYIVAVNSFCLVCLFCSFCLEKALCTAMFWVQMGLTMCTCSGPSAVLYLLFSLILFL